LPITTTSPLAKPAADATVSVVAPMSAAAALVVESDAGATASTGTTVQ
jgi:hypothetical protein